MRCVQGTELSTRTRIAFSWFVGGRALVCGAPRTATPREPRSSLRVSQRGLIESSGHTIRGLRLCPLENPRRRTPRRPCPGARSMRSPELFYIAPSGMLPCAAIGTAPKLEAHLLKRLFTRKPYLTASQSRSHDGSPDGQRFLFIKDSPGLNPELPGQRDAGQHRGRPRLDRGVESGPDRN